ncbi:MAG: PD-(D/E)XK nuclease family protein [Acidiferrobacterales bacterium]
MKSRERSTHTHRERRPQHTTRTSLELVPYDQDPLRALAERLLDRCLDRPPDLRHAVVLFSHYPAVRRFRKLLLDVALTRGVTALLPPFTGTLIGWLQAFADDQLRTLNEPARELLLMEALAEHPGLTQRWGTWPLVDSRLRVFDEISLDEGRVPVDLNAFAGLLAGGYGIPDPTFAPLSEEAYLAHTLWGAWRHQLAAEGTQDAPAQLLSGLTRSLNQVPKDTHIYLTGFVSFPRAIFRWIKVLRARGQLTVLLHGQYGATGYHPDDLITETCHVLGVEPQDEPASSAYNRFLNNVFVPQAGDLLERARRQAAACVTSPARGHLVVHEAQSFEDEARAIDIQVRRWRLQGHRHIGIVTSDRKLARRVRALLERANVQLHDTAGWRLSTSSAATGLMRWIECIERDFAYAPLVDLLNSPFVSLGLSPRERADMITWFEAVVVSRQNAIRNLARYRRAVLHEHERLDTRYRQGATKSLCRLLDTLERAAKPLIRLNDSRAHPVTEYLAAIAHGLEDLRMATAFAGDAAGEQLLSVLNEMAVATARHPLQVDWSEFNTWLRRNLERRRFEPLPDSSDVQLLSFSDSRLHRFDGVVIAGTIREHLPGAITRPAFFNDSARRQLGLPTLSTDRRGLFYDFRRLLEAAPRVLITLRQEHQGEPVAPSPWVERLRAFHSIAYAESLECDEHALLARSAATEIVGREPAPLPRPTNYPAPALPLIRVPQALSATAHQRLLDCPYQYYATDGLSLKPREAVRDQLEKREFGQRVHQILQAFHLGVPGLPGPFRKKLAADTRDEAVALLADIARVLFADDIQQSILARGWLFRWHDLIESYVEWESMLERGWTPSAAELPERRACENDTTALTLTARIDRLDRGEAGFGIIDYKTGRVPELAMILAGEEIQLPFYTLVLAQPAAQALYLKLTSSQVSDKVRLEREPLQMLAQRVRERILNVQEAIGHGTGLPAWGDDVTCAQCAMQGLCRKEMWIEEDRV